jgi:hypothetical protein
MTSVPLSLEEEHLPVIGKVVIQGLVFTWTCESGSVLKVQHPEYGQQRVHLDWHYEPHILAKLVALGMLGNASKQI